jgi:hypothetical protein
MGFVVDNVALGQVFAKYFGFSCQFSFHQLLHTHLHLSSGAGIIGQAMAGVPNGLPLTPPQIIKKGIPAARHRSTQDHLRSQHRSNSRTRDDGVCRDAVY